MRGGNGWIFSFDNICDLLGLDADYVRRVLLEERQPGAMRRRAA
jgi:hypothetical protein